MSRIRQGSRQGSAGAPGVLRPGCLHLVPTTCIMLRMRLSARADYALRAAIELAASGEGHVTAEQLAKAQQIPAKFLEAILTQLRRGRVGCCHTRAFGGILLARSVQAVSLAA